MRTLVLLQSAAQPSGLLIFGLLFVLIMGIVGMIALVGYTHERLTSPCQPTRSRRGAIYRVRAAKRSHAVQPRSPQPNAEKPGVQSVQPFTERSDLNAPATPMLPASLPLSDLQTLAHIITLYAKRPNKELAINGATGATKGAGEEYQKWSALFDTAMTEQVRAVAKGRDMKNEAVAA